MPGTDGTDDPARAAADQRGQFLFVRGSRTIGRDAALAARPVAPDHNALAVCRAQQTRKAAERTERAGTPNVLISSDG